MMRRIVAVGVTALSLWAAWSAWAPTTARGQSGTLNGEWRTYGGDLASTRYSPLDQINAGNFDKLEVAWRFRTESLGPRVENNLQATPLMVGGKLYLTAGTRRAAVSLDAATGEMRWMHSIDEGPRGAAAPRQLSGRGLAYWSDANEERILYVTPGYQLVALDAKTGLRIPGFGKDGIVDLKQELDQQVDLVNGEIGLHSAPVIARDVIIIGAAHLAGGAPRSKSNVKGYIRGYDVRTGKRLWIFHTIPRPGEFGNDTWLNDSWSYTGNAGVWAQMSVDEELGIVYMPVELPTGDYYGGHRPGNGLFGESVVAVDLRTGQRKWHYQLVHHGLWDFDIPCAPILMDLVVDGKPVKAVGQPTKQNWVYVFDRVTGQPIWPIVERPVEKGEVPGEYVLADAAVRDQAAGLRSSGCHHRRPDRLHAGAASRSRQARVAIQARSDVHAADCQQMGRSARDADAADGDRRCELAGRFVRSRNEAALRLFEHEHRRARAGAHRHAENRLCVLRRDRSQPGGSRGRRRRSRRPGAGGARRWTGAAPARVEPAAVAAARLAVAAARKAVGAAAARTFRACRW